MFQKSFITIMLGLLLLINFGCGPDDGHNADTLGLPIDTLLTLYCEDEGVFPETCILSDTSNPYRTVDVNEDNKWDLNDSAPSAKSKFYLWATALAKGAGAPGENQYFAARALHELYTDGGSVNAQEQAKKAYRSLLDNFYNSTTWIEAWWLPEKPSYPVPLKNLVGQNLWDPTRNNLVPLYDEPEFAAEDLGLWGYVLVPVLNYDYDDDGNIIGIIDDVIVDRSL